jgi:ArsR family transcriptional regulator, virulence genes transcriptional regulator
VPNSRRQPVSSPALVPDLDRLEEMHAHAAEAARLLKALGNEQRLLILCNLLDRPLSVGELNERLDLSQSALSQHLALLREAGLVDTRREAQSIYYSLPTGPVVRVMALMQEIYCSVPAAAKPARGSRSRRHPAVARATPKRRDVC